MSLWSLQNRLDSLTSRKSDMEIKKKRLEDSYEYNSKLIEGQCYDACFNLSDYMASVNPVCGDQSWEGQQVGLFKAEYDNSLYGAALNQYSRYSSIQYSLLFKIREYENEIYDLSQDITDCRNDIEEERERIRREQESKKTVS